MLKVSLAETLFPRNKIHNNGIQHTYMSYNRTDQIREMESEKKGTYREAEGRGRGRAWRRKGKTAFKERRKR